MGRAAAGWPRRIPMSSAQPQQAPGREQGARGACKLVAIGASAGAFDALAALFEGMPREVGAAFVVVTHLAPDRPSRLGDLLQPHCPLPVVEVAESQPLVCGRVYLIPPGRELGAVDTHLRLSPADGGRARKPIDHCLCALAESGDGDALGVILSGAGDDGAQGLMRIRARGGLVLVQDPVEAEHEGMPRSAIAAGVADRVLPLTRIRDAILRFCREGAVPGAAAPAHEDLLGDIAAAVCAHTGRDIARYRPEFLWPRIRRRMRLVGKGSAADYLALLRERPEEARALAGERHDAPAAFFADADAFAYLEQQVIPRLLDARRGKDDVVRVWAAGCASGEDAYSLAMLLREQAALRERPPELRVFATDACVDALARAREGIYPEEIAEHVAPARLQRFFLNEYGRYRVSRELRDQVIIARHDLLADPPFPGVDLVVCRGLAARLTDKARQYLGAIFHYALQPGGLLLLGPGEALGGGDLFTEVAGVRCLWRRRDEARGRLPRIRPSHSHSAKAAGPPEWPAPGAGAAPNYGAIHQSLAARYAPPSLLVDDRHRVVHYSAQVWRYLKIPGGTPTDQLFALVSEPLRGELRRGLRAVRETPGPWRSPLLTVATEAGAERVVIHLERAQEGEPLWLALFQSFGPPAGAVTAPEPELAVAEQRLAAALETVALERERARLLEEELASVTEEYRLTAEELESSKEELQSTNEELITINEENLQRILLLSQLSADQQHLLEATGIATLFLDRELNIMRYTPAAAELFRLLPEDRGRPLTDLANDLMQQGLAADAGQVLETSRGIEREVAGEDGRWHLVRVVPYCPQQKRVEGVVISLVDISARRRAEESLRAADRRKDEFLATLAHELRNPLAPLVSGLELLELGGDDPALRREVHERLERQVRQLSRLVDDLLDVARITRGTIELHTEAVDLADFVRDAVAAVQPGMREKGHELTVALPAAPLGLMADATRLTQVLSNLLSNAVKYTPAGGRIRLSAERQGDEAVVVVQDNGMGIDPGQLGCAFEMFTRVGTSLQAGSGGLGIGLSLAKRLAEMHGGTLTAHSEGPGKCSAFTLRLPLGQEQDTAAAPAAAVEDRSLGGFRVLIADDNEDAALSVAMLVRVLGGSEVHTAHDGVEAVEKARNLHPDIVVLDLGMPRMDGYEAASQIRREPWGHRPRPWSR
jgi:two-component system CheB/CheR fusion protein